MFAAISGKQRHFEAETVLAKVDGRTFDALFTCTFPDPKVGGPNPNIVVAIVYISARVQAQEALAKVQSELAHAMRVATLGELTASIAHEVNQPLAAIVANGEAGLRCATPDLLEVEAPMSRMIEEGRRASGIIARIRGMAAKGPIERQRFCPNRMVEDTASLVRRDMAAHGVVLRLELARDLPEITADRVQLQQVALNLMVNAAQAMAQQRDCPRLVTVRTALEDDAIAVEVADTGPGFGATRPERLFDAFYSTKSGGMGLGLSIAKSIISAHDGTITAAVAEPAGAVFRFTLPL